MLAKQILTSKCLGDLIRRRLWVVPEQRVDGHHHARAAESTLRAVTLGKPFLRDRVLWFVNDTANPSPKEKPWQLHRRLRRHLHHQRADLHFSELLFKGKGTILQQRRTEPRELRTQDKCAQSVARPEKRILNLLALGIIP
ncbi:hypothetical protein U0070_015244 [Myodes glareolus]|uniref:Uncharacterized protein n=1 Tax=Myodes glareolus TaxID=447135 RepID=A0AAW0JYL8_MYOGA